MQVDGGIQFGVNYMFIRELMVLPWKMSLFSCADADLLWVAAISVDARV